MKIRKIKVKSLISVTAWAVALGMFIARVMDVAIRLM